MNFLALCKLPGVVRKISPRDGTFFTAVQVAFPEPQRQPIKKTLPLHTILHISLRGKVDEIVEVKGRILINVKKSVHAK